MRRIHRQALTEDTLAGLAALTAEVISDADPKGRASKKWDSKPDNVFGEIRTVLVQMASGRARCMYCEDSAGTDIEHFRPKATYPEVAFVWDNYLLACSHCNSNRKRNLFPLDEGGSPLLIDPSAEDPTEHLEFSPSTGHFVAVTSKGEKSVEVFALNDDTRSGGLPTGRLDALVTLVALLKQYDEHVTLGTSHEGNARRAIQNQAFSAVLYWMVRVAATGAGKTVLGSDVVDLIQKYHVHTWL